MDLNVEHNLTASELSETIIALTKSHGLEYEVHECLSKAVTMGPKEPTDPLIARLLADFRHEYAEAIQWIVAFVDKVISGEASQPPRFYLFKAKPELDAEGPLSKEQIQQIQEAIRERFSFIARALESDFVPSKKLLKKWMDLGIIAPDVTADDFVSSAEGKLVRNAFLFGRMHIAIERGGMSFDEILRMALEAPLTKPDNYAIQFAERESAQYITKFGEDIAGEAGRLIDAKNRAIVRQMVVDMQGQKLEAIALRPGAPSRLVSDWRQLSSELYRVMEDKARDWEKIGFYETKQAQKEGQAMELLAKYGRDQLAYKVPLPTACPQCLNLYLDNNGVPRLFRLEIMLGYGNNIGRRPLPVRGGKVIAGARIDGADTLKPVVGLVHPYCECTGPFVLTGYEHWADQAERPTE